jgi:hypothetical protein
MEEILCRLSNIIKKEALTKTISGIAKFDSDNLTCTLDIGFEPKCFDILGTGNNTGIYLRWDRDDDWTGNAGFLYDYYIDGNTITISTHMTLNGEFIWRAFG